MKYRYQVEPHNGAFIVTRMWKVANKYQPDPHAHPVRVTNHEFLIVDLPALFENQDEVDRLRNSGGL